MIPHGVEVFVALEPINMAYSFDRLSGLVEQWVGRSVRDAAIFVFFNRRRTSLKAVFADSSGLCVFYKRADRGRFVLPEPTDDGRVVELSERELADLLDGVEMPRGRRPPRRKKAKPTVH